ncbi:hypothetical protein ACWFNE_02050 [Cellulomonas sp. NPDC055163]
MNAHPVPATSRLVLERPAENLTELAAPLAALADALAPGAAWVAGEPPEVPVRPAPAALTAYLAGVDAARRSGEPRVCRLLCDDGPEIVLDVEPTPAGGVGIAWLSVTGLPPSEVPVVAAAGAVAFEADYGRVEDEQLLLRYHGRRAHERALAATPPDLRRHVPAPPPVPDGLALPDLLVPQELDRLGVPPAVWWVNVWGPRQLATLGEARVVEAPWAHIRPLSGGRLLLLATAHPADPDDPADVASLRRLVDVLDLRAAQEAHRG